MAHSRRLFLERLESRTLLAVVTEFPLATAGSLPGDIARGSDGNLWFTEFGSDRIGRITPAGVITDFALAAGSGPTGIAAGRGAMLAVANLPDRLRDSIVRASVLSMVMRVLVFTRRLRWLPGAIR